MGDRRPCADKTRFHSGGQARKALTGIRKRGSREAEKRPSRAYPCPHCRGWHLTSDLSGEDT